MNITDFDKVIAMLNEGVQRGSIFVPEHYDWAKALSGVKSYISRMIASEKENENTILTGSPASLAGALKDMLTLGLSIEDKSCYLFKKSKKSDQYVLRRSYYGTQKVVRELYPDCQIFADVVYEGEAFDLGPFINGRPEKITHYPNLKCMNEGKMVASYAVILDKDEKVIGYGILTANTLANIQAANGGNFVNPVWKTYPEEMAKFLPPRETSVQESWSLPSAAQQIMIAWARWMKRASLKKPSKRPPARTQLKRFCTKRRALKRLPLLLQSQQSQRQSQK